MKTYVSLVLKRLLAFLPSSLPVGMKDFDAWAESIIELLPPGLDQVPVNDKKWVLASSIQHLPHTAAYVSKRYFVKLIHKAAASQVAGQIFMDLKTQKDVEQKAKAEATAGTTGNEKV